MRRMSQDQRDRVAEMREAGISIGAISRAIGFSRSAVSWVCLTDGAEPPHPPRPASVPDQPVTHYRGGKPVRRFTQAEDELILRLRAAGWTNHAIGRETGRRPHTILSRFATLARHQERLESGDD